MGTDQDFKYVMQDFSNVYIGARLTYEEFTQQADAPQRLCSAFFMYMFPEKLQQVRICDHIMTLEEGTMPYMVFAHCKAQMKLVTPMQKTDKKGNVSVQYVTKTLAVTDFIRDKQLRDNTIAEQISEITCKKLHLASLHV